MRWHIFTIAMLYIVVATAELTFHWYAGTRDTAMAHSLRQWYLRLDNGGDHNAGLVNLMLPSMLLGVALGSIGARWNPGELLCYAPLLALGVVVLYPAYATFIPWGQRCAMWPDTIELTKGSFFIRVYATALANCGFCTYGSRAVTREMQDRRNGPATDDNR